MWCSRQFPSPVPDWCSCLKVWNCQFATAVRLLSSMPTYSNTNAYVKPGSDDDLAGYIMGDCTENSIIDLVNKLWPLELLRITNR